MKNKLRLSALVLVFAMLLAACGNNGQVSNNTSNLPKGEVEYPIETDDAVSVWMTLDPSVSATVATANELPFIKELQERTGIKMEITHPAANQAAEKFNIMMASGQFPDICIYYIGSTPEGPSGLMDGGYVHELTEDFMKDYSPNMYKLLTSNEDLAKAVRTSDGRYFGFPSFSNSDSISSAVGLMMRKDWLDELNLEVPETLDDWHTVLTAFKDKKGATAPLTFLKYDLLNRASTFVGAFGIGYGLYVDDNGKVQYGLVKDEFKQFLEMFSQWYKEGLVDSNFVSQDYDTLKSKMLTGKSGATVGWCGDLLGGLIDAKPDEKYDLVAAPYPTLKKGDICEFGQKSDLYSMPSVWISGTSENKELAARLLDYAYTDEGSLLFNYGIEGKTYEVVDGTPKFTDYVVNNSDGLGVTEVLGQYTQLTYGGFPFKMDVNASLQRYSLDQQKDALLKWSNTNALNHKVKGTLGDEAQSIVSNYLTDINIYVDEATSQFMMGIKPLSEFDSFVETIKSMHIDEVIAAYQKAYDEYAKQ